MQLSARLSRLAAHVPQGSTVADIGCDHAYLAITLIERGQVTRAIGCDINSGPLGFAARHRARAAIAPERLDLRLGNGLAPLAPGEVDVVVIAGMGGPLMRQILEEQPEVTSRLGRLVLSPNVAPWQVREWAMEKQFAIVHEEVLQEHGKYYEIIVLEPSCTCRYEPYELYFGPHLLRDRSDMATAYFADRRRLDMTLIERWMAVLEAHPELAPEIAYKKMLWQSWEAMRWS